MVSGYGTYSDNVDVNANDYVTAARTPDGRLTIAYLPTGRPIDVDMATMSGPLVRAQWYDPTTGTYAAVPGSPFPPRGIRRLTVPGKNREGDRDWALVLTAT